MCKLSIKNTLKCGRLNTLILKYGINNKYSSNNKNMVVNHKKGFKYYSFSNYKIAFDDSEQTKPPDTRTI